MKDLQRDLERVYTGLQNLQVQPTKTNTAIILDALIVLEKCFNLCNEQEREDSEQEGAEEDG